MIGYTFIVNICDRLARSFPDVRDMADGLTRCKAKLCIGSSVRELTDPAGRLLFNVLATVAGIESELFNVARPIAYRIVEPTPEPKTTAGRGARSERL